MTQRTTPAVLSPGETITTARLRLGELPPDAVEAMPWLAAALAPEWRLEDLVAAIEAGDAVAARDAGGEALGVAVAFLDRPVEGEATIPFLAVQPERRFRGLGGEAGIALDRHLRGELGFEKVYAPVPEGRGLAVYFWLRLGFRPLSAAESPNAPLGLTSASLPGIWMLRDGFSGVVSG